MYFHIEQQRQQGTETGLQSLQQSLKCVASVFSLARLLVIQRAKNTHTKASKWLAVALWALGGSIHSSVHCAKIRRANE